MKKVSSQEFKDALKDDNFLKIMNNVIRRYRKHLSSDDAKNCRWDSLWQSMANYVPEKGMAFTSYLYLRTKWNCMGMAKKRIRENKGLIFTADMSKYRDVSIKDETMFIDIRDDKRPEQNSYIEDRYIHNMSFEEIATKRHIATETARKRLLEAESRISKNWL